MRREANKHYHSMPERSKLTLSHHVQREAKRHYLIMHREKQTNNIAAYAERSKVRQSRHAQRQANYQNVRHVDNVQMDAKKAVFESLERYSFNWYARYVRVDIIEYVTLVHIVQCSAIHKTRELGHGLLAAPGKWVLAGGITKTKPS